MENTDSNEFCRNAQFGRSCMQNFMSVETYSFFRQKTVETLHVAF